MIIKSYIKIILPEQRNPKITQIILNKADSILQAWCSSILISNVVHLEMKMKIPYCKNHEYICARCDFMFVYYKACLLAIGFEIS